MPRTSFEDTTPLSDDFQREAELITDFKASAHEHGFQVVDFGVKENKNGREVSFRVARTPWEQAEIPFEKPGDLKVTISKESE